MEKLVTVRLDITLFEAVSKYAKENDMRISQVIRSSLKQRINYKSPVIPINTKTEASENEDGDYLQGWSRQTR